MPPRNVLFRLGLLLPHRGGGGVRGSRRTLLYASFHQDQLAPSSAPPPRSHSINASPSPSAAAFRGGGAVATRPRPSPSSSPVRPYNPMVSYLVRACRFSFDEAVAASELLSGNKPQQNHESSASAGYTKSPLETQIGWLVSSRRPSLGGRGDMNSATGDPDFSGRTLAQLMLLDSGILTLSRKIGFWCALFRAEADLLRALKLNTHSPGSGSKEKVTQKMLLLQRCGMPKRELRALLQKESEAVTRSVQSLEALIKRVEELGLAGGRQAAYQYALQAIGTLSKRKLEAKLESVNRNEGRGELKALQAIGDALRFPNGLLRNKGKAIDAPVSDGRMEISSASADAIPLALSLEKKVMPPYYVLQVLRSKDCQGGNQASYMLRTCKKARFWTNSYASMKRQFQSFMKLKALLVLERVGLQPDRLDF